MYVMLCSHQNLSYGVIGCVDSYFVGSVDRRRSLSGHVFIVGGCAINWKVNLQTIMTIPTIEVKLVRMLFG